MARKRREYAIFVAVEQVPNQGEKQDVPDKPKSPTGTKTTQKTEDRVGKAAVGPVVKSLSMQLVRQISGRVGMVIGNNLVQEKINAYSGAAITALTGAGLLVHGNVLGFAALMGTSVIGLGAKIFDYNFAREQEGVAIDIARQRMGGSVNRFR